jgi:hypothetical protein
MCKHINGLAMMMADDMSASMATYDRLRANTRRLGTYATFQPADAAGPPPPASRGGPEIMVASTDG